MKTNFTLSTKLFIIILLSLFASITNIYAQDTFDGDYCPAPNTPGDEYATGIFFSQQLSVNASSTCQIGTIHAKVNTITQVLRLGMNIGNGGAALFRMYLDTDNNPITGLTSDTFGGALSVAGAEYIIEINSNASTFNLYSGNGSTLTPLLVNNGLAAKNGSAVGCSAGGGEFLEFNIPFGSIGINICDPLNPGFIKITKLASVSGNSPSSSRCINTALTFGIPLKGSVEPSSTVCSGINSSLLNVTGITGSSTITKWQSSVSPFTTWTDIANTSLTYTATNLTATTKFRALFSNTGLCAGNDITTSEATITVNPSPNAPTASNLTVCSNGSPTQTLTATATGGTITWYDAATAGNVVATPTQVGVGTKTYYAQASNGTCPSLTRTPVVLTINTIPSAPSASNQTVCTNGSPTQTLTATATGGTITWYDAATGGNVVASPTQVGVGSKTYYAEASNGTCSSLTRTIVILTINPAPNAPSASNQTVCTNGSPTQTLTATATGGTITWYDAATTGNVVASPTQVGVGTKTYYAEASDGTCSSLTRTAVVLTINVAPNSPAASNQTVCTNGSPSQTLTATATGGTITWYDAATAGNVVASPTQVGVGTKTYYAESSNGTCSSLTRTAVILTINPAPNAPIASNQTVCTNGSPTQTLTATATGGTITWYDAATAGNIITTPTQVGVGTKTYYAEASNGICSSLTRTLVILTINPAPSAPVASNQTVCTNGSPTQTLTATATGGTITWYDAATAGNIVSSPTQIGVGTTTYYAESSNGTCSSLTRTAVILTINPAPSTPIASNQTVCTNGSPTQTLTATATGGTITWYDAATAGNSITTPTQVGVGTKTYYAEASNGTCSSLTRTQVILTINPAPNAPVASNQTVCTNGSPTQTLTATATGGTITWYDAATAGNIVPSPTQIGVGTKTYYAEASNGTCSSLTRTAVILTINPAPNAPEASNQTVCTNGSPTQTLTATATGGTITWYDAATAGNIMASPTQVGVGTSTYYAQASNGTCSSLTRTTVILTINSAPNAPISSNQTVCTNGSPTQTLTATATGGIITWYDAATAGNIVASPTQIGIGTKTYYAQASNGTCSSLTRTPVILTINPAPNAPVASNQTVCTNGSLTQTLTATATGGTVTWYDAATAGNVVPSPTQVGIGTTTYYAEASNGTCSSLTRTPVVLTINPAPNAPVASNQTVCTNGSLTQTLTATASGGTITWYDAVTAGNVVPSPTQVGIGTSTYYAEASNGTCSSLTRTAVILTINDGSIPPSATNQTICTNGSPTQTLTATASGGIITWYDAATAGNVVNSPTQVGVGTSIYYAQASNGTCSSLTRTAVVLTINPAPNAPVASNQTVCTNGSQTQTLTATATGGTITWYDAATAGNSITTPTQVGVGTKTYYAEASNGTCSSLTRTPVILTINPAPTAPVASNQTVCTNGSPTQTLTATATGGTITWYDAATAGNIVASPTQIGVGTITYYAEASNGTCSSLTRTPVVLTINAAPSAPIASNQTICTNGSTTQTLTATATGGTITWYDAATAGNVVTTPTQVGIGTITYYAEASNGTCSSLTRTPVVLTINAAPNAPAANNQTVCSDGSQTQTLTATATGGTITWYDAAIAGNVVTTPTLIGLGTVTYYAEASNGTCSSLTRTAVVLTINSCSIALVKTNDITVGPNGCADLKVGDVVTYTFTVTNLGNSSLHDVVVIDSHIGLSTITLQSGDSNNNSILEVSENWIYEATYTVTQIDIDNGSITNQATVNATASDSTLVSDPSGNSTTNDEPNVIPICTTAKIALVKTNDIEVGPNGCADLKVGDVVTYTFSVVNLGNVSLHDIVVLDNHAGLSTIALQSGDSNNNSILEVTENWIYKATYTVTQTDIDTGSITNQAFVNGTTPKETEVTDQSGNSTTNDEPNVIPICTTAKIVIVKSNNIEVGPNGCADLKVGDVVTYTFTVTNLGNVSLHDVAVLDPHIDLSTIVLQSGDSNSNSILEVNENWIYTATYTVDQSDIDTGSITNQASVNGTAPNATVVMDQSGDSTTNDEPNVIPICTTAKIAIVKSNDVEVGPNGCATLKVGDVVTYTFSVTNFGNVSLHDIGVIDLHSGISAIVLQSGDSNNNNILEVTENWIYKATYTVTQTDIDTGSITNQASVNGTAPNATIITDQSGDLATNDEPNVIPICSTNSIALVKTAVIGGAGAVGDVITYTFAVTNTGNATITNIIITDITEPLIGLTFTNSIISALAPGVTNSTITGTYIITQADINLGHVTNSALAVGQDPKGNDVRDISGTTIENDTPTITTLIQNPSLTVIKTSNTEFYSSVGDIINYTIQVKNTGNVTLHQITVTDPLTSLDTIIELLGPGETQEFNQNYTVTQNDRETGSVTNVANATGFTPNESSISASDTVVVEAAIVLGCGSITVHNAFSPNGDGINELFIIDNIDDTLCYPDNTVEIYNRWGILVFETRNYDNVNRVFKGFSEGRTTISQSSGLPTGTYYYILSYSSIDGNGGVQVNKKDGYLYLTR
ncbi:gliding motility-associated C-terminal domain-containing protein [Flavobacterium sp. WC2409]|uniref:Gliding motility-associated C-terminal domain-containing protein n=1 Tax=Flavobacterium sp. WC2409 TaxID=3234139 RepID=A0AB39W7S4_9FLAO